MGGLKIINIFKEKLFYGKVAIVTGGSGGIGKAVSAALAELGAQIIIVSRNKVRGIKIEHNINL